MKGSLLPKLTKSLKLALAAVLAIASSEALGLKYSATAGIITILSIQGTKLETLRTAGKRALAFLCALILAGACYGLLGYTVWAFGIYLFLFVLLCLVMRWQEAIAMDSVLVSHFWIQGCFFPLLWNEALLFIVGTGAGILVNLHLRGRREQFTRLSDRVDGLIREILGDMSRQLMRGSYSDGEEPGYAESNETQGHEPWQAVEEELLQALRQAEDCAVENYGNTPFSRDTYELDYVRMRQRQTVILRAIRENIRGISYQPRQAGQVALLLERVRQEYHRYNNVEGLLAQMEELYADMQTQPLPQSREEFEARAVLFYILRQMEQLLKVKKQFIGERG
ncbi:MAG: aromatic acid exporter family protein [bacterium]|nr:aromatic acid exporter family protein [bacterium]MCM1376355.1 aromatic acid exporter family protein [Muribaculum sp.]